MAIAVKLDFDDVYDIKPLSEDLRISTFETELSDGSTLPLLVEISNDPHELLPEVFNLAFGPPTNKGEIDDKAEITHKNYSRTFSSILLSGLIYLNSNTAHYLGIDGSNNARAYLYYRFLQQNYDYLDRYFNVYGLKYYVRISRFGKHQYDNPFDFNDIYPFPEKIKKAMQLNPDFMYNYFIFNRKHLN